MNSAIFILFVFPIQLKLHEYGIHVYIYKHFEMITIIDIAEILVNIKRK